MNMNDDEIRLDHRIAELRQDFTSSLHQIEIQVTKLTAHLESEQSNYTRILDELRQLVVKHDKMIVGNGSSEGLALRLDRLEQAEKERKQKEAFQKRVTWTIIGALVVQAALTAASLLMKAGG